MSKDEIIRMGHARVQRIGTGCFVICIDEDHPNVDGDVGDNVLLITLRSVWVDGVRRMRARLATEGGLELVAALMTLPPQGDGEDQEEWTEALRVLLGAMIDLAVTAVTWRVMAGDWPDKPEELARDPKLWAQDRAAKRTHVECASPVDSDRRLDVLLHLALGGSKTPPPKA